MSASARAVVEEIARHWAVPGGAVLAVDRDGIELLSHRWGHADVAADVPVAPEHLFEIGSISKAFTAIAVLRLVRRGLLRLQDPVAEVLDHLPKPLRDRDVTIERLLTHTAGLVASVDAVPDEIGQVTTFAGGVSPAGAGSFFHYSNLGYVLLGQVVAHVTGRPLAEMLAAEVLGPLGMTSSIAAVTHDDYATLARGYQPLRDDQPWTPGDLQVAAPWMEVAGADGNVAAPIGELARFARMLLGRGTLAGTTILTEAEFVTMTTTTAPDGEDVLALRGVPPTDGSRYGLGINVERAAGRTILTHGGGMVGYASFLYADLDAGVAVCVVTNANGDSPVAEAIARGVAAELRVPGVVDVAGLDPRWWHVDCLAGRVGDFVAGASAGDRDAGPSRITVTVSQREGEYVRLAVACDGDDAPLLRTWNRGAVTPLPALRRFSLRFAAGTWQWGSRTFSARPTAAGVTSVHDAWEPCCGHYRSYSPWFTNFRVVVRGERLLLIAAGGVEAPADELDLIPLGDGTFRVGADPRLPERIRFGPAVNGRSPWADRDGCRYSRAFTA